MLYWVNGKHNMATRSTSKRKFNSEGENLLLREIRDTIVGNPEQGLPGILPRLGTLEGSVKDLSETFKSSHAAASTAQQELAREVESLKADTKKVEGKLAAFEEELSSQKSKQARTEWHAKGASWAAGVLISLIVGLYSAGFLSIKVPSNDKQDTVAVQKPLQKP